MAIKKKRNKFVVPQEYNQSAIFARGGNLYGVGDYLSIPKIGVGVTGGPDLSKITQQGVGKLNAAGAIKPPTTPQTPGLGAYLGAAQGAIQLGSQAINNLDTSGIGNEVVGTNEMSRNDILNTNVNVDSKQSNVGGQALSGAMTGASALKGFGLVGTIAGGIGGGIIGAGTALLGNNNKQDAANQAEQQWTNNLQAKNRQFNQQDMRNSMANFAANGGYIFANGGSNLPITNNPGELTGYNMFRGTLPSNQANNGTYDLFTGWKDYGKPMDFNQAQQPQYKDSQPWMTRESDGYHAKSAGYNEQTGNYDFLKDKNHKTIAKELEWYNSKDGSNFKSQYDLDTSGDYYKYTPKKNILEMNRTNQQYANGGDLFAYGGQMPSQLTSFDAGKSHEENPNGGIMQGTGANGQPNLVEEGETKHEDYIFSDRLKVNPQISKDFKLPAGLNGKTFAQASKYLNREAKDRPNDPISNNAVKAHLAKLTAAQEGLKEQMQPQQGIPMEGQPNANMLAQGYANGGYIDQTHYQNPTLQGANIGAMGGNMFAGPQDGSNQMGFAEYGQRFNELDPQNAPQYTLPNLMNPTTTINSIVNPATGIDNRKQYAGSEHQKNKIMNKVAQDNWNKSLFNNYKSDNSTSEILNKEATDYSRYAPVAANMAMGISDMFEQPEVVKYGRVNPERVTARMDYQPIDTEWMNNKMNATYAGTRDQMINNAGGNRAIAMAGLSGINQQQQNAVGEAYMKAQDINYGRKNQATQFNAGIEAQNIAAQNAAQQANLQLQMQEMDANARNRAAKRNAARQAILNAASNVGDIGRENYFGKLTTKATGYNPMDALKYSK